MIGIYKITSPKNKIYIGQSWNIEKRFSSYKGFYCENQRKLYSSLKKYGYENHKFEVIHNLPLDVTQDIMNLYEIFYWQQYKDCGFKMMNIRQPGSNGKHSDETKLKIGKSGIGRKQSQETINKIREAKKGKKQGPRSEEHKNNIRESVKKSLNNIETRKKISDSVKKAMNNPDIRKKISDAAIAQWSRKRNDL